jgi:ABC-type multidrug transport system permease subunit
LFICKSSALFADLLQTAYLVSGIIATGLANTDVVCAANEYVRFNPVGGQNCGDYVRQYTQTFGGYVANPTASTDCQFCSISSTNTFLAAVNANYDQRWRNFGILFAFIFFNIIAAFGCERLRVEACVI